MALTYRSVKGSALTITELDNNYKLINTIVSKKAYIKQKLWVLTDVRIYSENKNSLAWFASELGKSILGKGMGGSDGKKSNERKKSIGFAPLQENQNKINLKGFNKFNN